MTTKSHTVLHLSIGSGLLLGVATIALGVAVLFCGSAVSEPATPTRHFLPRIGTASSAEATYGPVNQAALHAPKQGLLRCVANNIRNRRASRRYQPAPLQSPAQSVTTINRPCVCRPQQTAVVTTPSIPPSVVWSTPQYVEPVYRVPKPAPVIPLPLSGPSCVGPECQLDIAPSQSAGSADTKRLELSYGPLNKAAQTETKHAAVSTGDPADQKPTLPPWLPLGTASGELVIHPSE